MTAAITSPLCRRLLGSSTSRNVVLGNNNNQRRARLLHHHPRNNMTQVGRLHNHRYYFSRTNFCLTGGGIGGGNSEGESSLLKPAGLLFDYDTIITSSSQHPTAAAAAGDLRNDELDAHLLPKDGDNLTEHVKPLESEYFFIPQQNTQNSLLLNNHVRGDGHVGRRKRVLVLCTGGTLTMAPNSEHGGALSPVPGALTDFMKSMLELTNCQMPEVVVHEYTPLLDSSDMGPCEWSVMAHDIQANYLHFDGFVVITGTDTMAYAATALSFMFENLSKPIVFTGAQIPLGQPHSDARHNLLMALIFAAREKPICEVTIFFHDRLLRACRAQKIDAGALFAFDSPNMLPLATIGMTIQENSHVILPPPRNALRVHTKMDTRLLALRLVPGFDDQILSTLIEAGAESQSLRALILQLYGCGNAPAAKQAFINCIKGATELGILVIASTQCHKGTVMMGHYATGKALASAGVISSNDMTLEAISCKTAYLMGRGDLSNDEIGRLMCEPLRGEVTHTDAIPPPPFLPTYQRIVRSGRSL